jgi:hypothetical protein
MVVAAIGRSGEVAVAGAAELGGSLPTAPGLNERVD